MKGFTIFIGKKSINLEDDCSELIEYKANSKEYLFAKHFDTTKFKDDKLFHQDKDFVIGIDGVILNLQSLKNEYVISNYFLLILNLFKRYKMNLASTLRGEFNGFIFEKSSEKLCVFNNRTATKQVFYYKYDDVIVISQSVDSIVRIKQRLNYPSYLNNESVYHMFCFSAMNENNTLVKDVYKLGAGEYLEICNGDLKLEKYYNYNNIDITISDKSNAIDKLDEAFIEAVRMEYKKDSEYHFNHFATLSGGLDSRMNVMIANKLGFKPKTFCFSQSNYYDEIIAREIATDLDLEFEFVKLDGGDYMMSLEEMNSINSGLQCFTGGAHYNYALKKTNLEKYGLIHSGQIGDAILGGFVTKNNNYLSKIVSQSFFDKIKSNIHLDDKYRTEEIYKLHQVLFNNTNLGSYITEYNNSYLVSPFFDNDVLEISFSIDPKLKYNQAIYIDWINKKHPDITKYNWERTRFRPNKKWKTELSRYTNKIRKEYLIFTNQKHRLSMTPEAFWLESSKKIQKFYVNVFESNIDKIASNNDLYKDFCKMFEKGNHIEKSIVITILDIVNKYNLKI